MTNETKLSRETAEALLPLLMEACNALGNAGAIAKQHGPSKFAEEFCRRGAYATAAIGWDILEQMIYSEYPDLRPYSTEGTPNSASPR